MRRITVLISTLAFALSGLTFSPASAVVSQVANATPATFTAGVQSTSQSDYFNSISCPSVGNCVAAGQFKTADGFNEAFTQIQTNGIWGNATPAVFANGIQEDEPIASFDSVSCSSVGNCVAVGNFFNADYVIEAFTQTLTNGIWGNATPAVFANGIQYEETDAYFFSVSCASAGNCVAVGQFRNATGGYEAFTQTLTSGIWGSATPVVFADGIQSTIPSDSLFSVSCSSAGNCVAGGQFVNATGLTEAFTQTLTSGIWGSATPVVFANGIQNTNPYAGLFSVSCSSAGNCVAGGQFVNAAGDYEAFTQTLTSGIWGSATPVVFANGIQNTEPQAGLYSVSCSSAGNCVAGGRFKNAAGGTEAFTQTLTSGIWGSATPVTFAEGIRDTNTQSASLNSVSCSSAGNCVAVGQFRNAAGDNEAFTQTRTNGQWTNATQPIFATGIQLANPLSSLDSVSCPAVGNCVAAGNFANPDQNYEAFTQVIEFVPPAPTNNYINSITQAKAWANVDFTLPALTTGKYDRVAYSVNGGSWVSWGLNAKSVQSIKGLATGREYSIRIRGHVKRGAWTAPSEPVTIFMKKIRGGVVVP